MAEIFSVEPSTVRRWIDAKKIAAIRTPSGQNRIPRSAVDALLGQHGADEAEVTEKTA